MSSRLPIPVGKIFFVGAVVPALFAWIDSELLRGIEFGTAQAPVVFAIFVSQVVVLGILIGRLIDWPVLRAFMYGWGWLFLNAQVLAAIVVSVYSPQERELGNLVSAIFGAQIGLLLMWAMLGTQPKWAARWPIAIMLSILLVAPCIGWRAGRADVIAIQIAVLLLICGILVRQGFRLFRPDERDPTRAPGTAGIRLPRAQFGVRHLLIWTTTIAVLLAVLKGFDLLSLREIRNLWRRDIAALGTTGCLSAIVLVVSLWAGLGAGPASFRWPLGILGGPAIGSVLGFAHWITRSPFGRTPRNRIPASAWDQYWSLEGERIAWLGLAGTLLFAGLLFFRAQGVRLGRVAKASDAEKR